MKAAAARRVFSGMLNPMAAVVIGWIQAGGERKAIPVPGDR